MTDGVAQAGFYSWEPGTSEAVFDDILRVTGEVGIPVHTWDGDVADTDYNISSDDQLLLGEDRELKIRFKTDEQTDRQLKYFFSLSTTVGNLTVDENKRQYSGFTARFVNLVRQFSVTLEPDYVSIIHPDPDVGPSPLEVMPTEGEFELERLPWLSVYSPSLLDQFGWTDRISDAPAWKVEELDTGAVLLIKTKEPWADVSRDHPVDRYLLDGEET